MEPTDKEINELRSNFLKKCEEENTIALGTFHPDDVERAKNDDDWLRRFLLHHENDQKEALNMLMETCDWRKKFGANDISAKTINQQLLERGSVFSHGKEKDGKTLLIFKSKKHIKGANDFDELKRHLVYWMERLERQENGEMISIFFDMDGAGFSNMDMEYTKYIISLFKNYYPHFLNYIIIFEMAWVLNAAFKIIKTWLPPKAIKKIKFLNKSNLKEIVDPDQALKSWGGLNDYVFTFTPEVKNGEVTPVNEECKKKVHFVEDSSVPVQDFMNESGFMEPTSSETSNPLKLSIFPSEFLPFYYDGADLTSSILIKNEDIQCLSYKIKTTAPKKFRVRPSMGILNPDKCTTVSVVMMAGYDIPSLTRDKFLIMSLAVDSSNISPDTLMELWKDASEADISRFKLRCTFSQSIRSEISDANDAVFGNQTVDDQKLTKITSDVINIQSAVCSLKEDIKVIQRQQWIIVSALTLFLACFMVYLSNGNNAIDNGSCGIMNATDQ